MKRKIKIANQKPSVKELDDLCRSVVFRRATAPGIGPVCERCGSDSHLQWSHFLSRSNKAVRWDLDNSFCLCAGCHTMRLNSAHKDPAGFVEWVKGRLGEERYDALRLRAAAVKGIDRWAVKAYLDKKMRELNGK